MTGTPGIEQSGAGRSRRCLPLVVLLLGITLVLAGCGGSSQSNPPPPPIPGKLYVTNGSTHSVLRFPSGATGDTAPEATASLGSDTPSWLSIDVAHNRLAILSFVTNSILLVDNASGAMSSPRVISGAATTMSGPNVAALDSTNDLLYVVDNDTKILVFGPLATINGNVAPLRTITLPTPSITGIALDTANNRLFVMDATNTAIDIFDNASSLSGLVSPNRILTGAATQLKISANLLVDSGGRLLVGTGSPLPSVLVYANAATISGNVAPSAAATFATVPLEMAVSPTEDLYVVDGSSSVAVFGNITVGFGSPVASHVISGPHTGLDPLFPNIPPLILGVAFDPTR